MKFQKLSSTDAFVVHDLDAATVSVGVARLAPKVLRDGAELLARSTTYAFAAFGIEGHAGASAGINAKPDDRAPAIAAFNDELAAVAGEGSLVLSPGVGLSPDDLAPLGAQAPDVTMLVRGAAAAASGTLGELAGCRAVVSGASDDVVAALTSVLAVRDVAETVAAGVDETCDVLFVAGKAGAIDHDAAANVKARAVVPLSPVPVTARAYAVLRKAERTYVPDFVSTAAPLLTRFGGLEGDDAVGRVHALTAELASAGPGAFLVAVGLAEAFLASWQDEQPFGRPLA